MKKIAVKKIILLFIALFIGASLGAFIRNSLIMLCTDMIFPIGILFANMLGSFLLGLFYSKPQEKHSCQTVFIATACLGTLTTFSTFIHDIFLIILIHSTKFFAFIIPDHIYNVILEFSSTHAYATLNLSHAFLNLCLNIVLCLFCVYLGKKRGFIRLHEKSV